MPSASALMATLLSYAKGVNGNRNADVIGGAVKDAIRGAGQNEVKADVDRLINALRDDRWGLLKELGDDARSDLNVELKPQAGDDGE